MSQHNVSSHLLRELWARFGTAEHPAEWDGKNYGGGKLSQRYWEYMKAIQLLELGPDAVVLDIGGGSPETGLGFFSSLISTAAKKVIVMDPNVGSKHPIPVNVEVLRELADFESLKATFNAHPEITHVTCISVFEHVPDEVRVGIVRSINEYFRGSRFVLTLEYHPIHRFFEYQLTAKTLADLMAPLSRFYPLSMEASPVHAEDAFFPSAKSRPGVSARTLLRKLWPQRFAAFVPRWYPLAIAFEKAS